ncbi:hypothetical protein PIB30_070258 [Stylosanthes scabra]|uniref:Uncharacterized protein n=1 Tax=Stylosanthes scabra TaxID=79078 RepID=A0ABU6XP63_9FABA|nr:hypothetical protein [Stylosanthes scabra]
MSYTCNRTGYRVTAHIGVTCKSRFLDRAAAWVYREVARLHGLHSILKLVWIPLQRYPVSKTKELRTSRERGRGAFVRELSRAAPKEEVVNNASSDSEVNKEDEDAAMELIAMDEPLILEKEDEEEEKEDPEEEEEEEEEGEDPEAEEEILEHFCDEDDYEDYFSAKMTTFPMAPLGATDLQDAKARA